MSLSQQLNQATQHLRQGAVGEASKILAAVLARDPDNVEALSLMSILHIQMQDPQTAVELLARASALEPGHPGILLNLAGALRMLGRFGQAITCLERAVALKPEAAQAALPMLAQVHLQAGNFASVIETCNTLLSADSKNIAALNLRAIATLEQGDPAGSLRDFDAIQQLGKGSPAIIGQKATALSRAGRTAEALDTLDQALRLHPREPSLHRTQARILLDAGDATGATQACDRALAMSGPEPLALMVKGDASMRQNDPASACKHFQDALMLAPSSSDACVSLASAMLAAGRNTDALQLLASQPGQDPRSHILRARALKSQSRLAEARAELDVALHYNPCDEAALLQRLDVNRHLGNFHNALADSDRLRQLLPASSRRLTTHGHLQRQLGQVDEAIETLVTAFRLDTRNWLALQCLGCLHAQQGDEDAALAFLAGNANAFQNKQEALLARGNILLDLRRVDEAISAFNDAAELDASPLSQYYRALALLTAGHLQEGFSAYEWRRRGDHPILDLDLRGLPEPRTLDDLKNKKLLLIAEQGLGDTLQFARFATRLLDHAASVALIAHTPLRALLASLHPDIAVYTFDDSVEADLALPLMSLPWFLGLHNAADLGQSQYLFADETLRARWKSVLGPQFEARVGICWSGNPLHANDAMRSLPLSALEPLAALRGVRLVSLQPEVRETDEIPFASASIVDFRDMLANFSQTAALVSELDLVITVDTSVAHLAGALGIPAWILLPFNADWRWMTKTPHSPWYPAATLFRQPSPGSWKPVIDDIETRLRQLVSSQQ